MNTRTKYRLIQVATVMLVFTVFFTSVILCPQYLWLPSFPVLLIAFISLKLSRKCLCPKCHKPIGEGPGIEFAGMKSTYCTPWSAKTCRFCGAEIDPKTKS